MTGPSSSNAAAEMDLQLHHSVDITNPPDPVAPRHPNLPSAVYISDRKSYLAICLPLYEAALKGDWQAALGIIVNFPQVINVSITQNYETALHIASSTKHTQFVEELVKYMEPEDLELQNKHWNTALCLSALAGTVKIAEILIEKKPNLLTIRGNSDMTPLVLAALFGQRDMVSYLYFLTKNASGADFTHGDRIVLLHACVTANIYDIALLLLHCYKELALATDNNVLHVLAKNPSAFARTRRPTFWRVLNTILHRQESVYNLLYEIGSTKDLITTFRDTNDNNILHLAALIPEQSRLDIVSGPALQMQREIFWFKEVESMVRPSSRGMENKQGKTPQNLFLAEHAQLMVMGERWMKETAAQCMVVAALVATITFAAAFTLPGGNNQDSGHPIFKHKSAFIVFVITDAISLFSSSASILMFLAILTSRYAERDFLVTLPLKLMFGLFALFVSITTMMVAFSASFFLVYTKGLKWVPVLIVVLAGIPVVLFAGLQFRIFLEAVGTTYGSRFLFKPRKHMLY